MTDTPNTYRSTDGAYLYVAQVDSLTAAGNTTPIKLSNCTVTVQVTGAATAATVQVQRSTIDPTVAGNTPNWGNVGSALTGDPATGITNGQYTESGDAWWRAVLTSPTGSPVVISIDGKESKAVLSV